MIYLKDSATGVTVEDADTDDWSDGPGVVVTAGLTKRASSTHYFTDDRADSILRGLLRWKLETGATLREGTIDALKCALKELTWEMERNK